MEKLIIATRFFHMDWTQQVFIEYYLEAGAEEIQVFCVPEDETILKEGLHKWISTNQVKLFPNLPSRIHCYLDEWTVTRSVYTHCLSSLKEGIAMGNQYLVAFPDHDEFIEFESLHEDKFQRDHLIRAHFFEWYLSPDQISQEISAREMLHMATAHLLKGKILEMWGDPYYKDYVYRIGADNYQFFLDSYPLGGFHRLIHENKAFVPERSKALNVHHLKGIPDHVRRPILEFRKELAKDYEDDWIAWHFRDEMKKLNEKYAESYEPLKSSEEMVIEVASLVQNYDPSNSVFDQVVVRQNLDLPNFSRPGLFH